MASYGTESEIDLSVVIATYNRCSTLRTCLQALNVQTLTRGVEVIVVVDGSNDGTREMLNQLKTPFLLRVVWQENAGQAAALNRGAEAATGNTCLFLDDDIIADPALFAEHLRLQEEPVVGLGRLTISAPSNADGLVRHYMEWWNGHYQRLDDGRPLRVTDCFSGNLSVPRSAFLESGGFAEDLPRLFDIELGYRLCHQGVPLAYNARATARQHFTKGTRAMLLDAQAEGASEVEIYRRHPAMLPELRLGTFCSETTAAMLLHRVLLRSPRLLPAVMMFGGVLRRMRLAPNWYRFLYSYWFWRGAQHALQEDDLWSRVTSGTVILMYHAFAADGERPTRFVLSGRRFAQQMAWLRRRGYHVLSLDDYLAYRDRYSFPPARSVVITMDDGYADVRTIAYPIVKRLAFHITVFLVTEAMGSTNTWDEESDLGGRSLLCETAVREMERATVSYGAHSRTHPALTSLQGEEARNEIAGSRQDLTALLGHPPLSFAYPYGKTNGAVESLVQAAGYAGAATVRPGLNGPATSRFALHRVEVRGRDSFLRFLFALWTGRTELRLRARKQTRDG